MRGAGTDANVFVTMYGDKGKTDEVPIGNATDNFEQGQLDKFKVCHVRLFMQRIYLQTFRKNGERETIAKRATAWHVQQHHWEQTFISFKELKFYAMISQAISKLPTARTVHSRKTSSFRSPIASKTFSWMVFAKKKKMLIWPSNIKQAKSICLSKMDSGTYTNCVMIPSITIPFNHIGKLPWPYEKRYCRT